MTRSWDESMAFLAGEDPTACEVCGGTGYIIRPALKVSNGAVSHAEPCERCDGSGTEPIPLASEDQAGLPLDDIPWEAPR